MLACVVKPAPPASPAKAMQRSPVWAAASPRASTTATWRYAACSSPASSASSAARGGSPAASASSSRGPYAGSAIDCVATAPTPGRAQETIEPTENQCDWTATPISPLAASRATIE